MFIVHTLVRLTVSVDEPDHDAAADDEEEKEEEERGS